MLLHRMARYATRTARAQHVSRGDSLGAAAVLEHHPQAGRIVLDRRHLRAVFDRDAEAVQVLAQDRLGPPLRQAALEFIVAADIGEFRPRDLLQAGAEDLNLPDAHARAKKRLDQAAAVKNLQHRRLDRGPASLAMRGQPALHDARLDAMAKQLGRREQSGRTAPHDQDGRGGYGRTVLVVHWQKLLSVLTGAAAARLVR
jgi:hypothetical protein